MTRNEIAKRCANELMGRIANGGLDADDAEYTIELYLSEWEYAVRDQAFSEHYSSLDRALLKMEGRA